MELKIGDKVLLSEAARGWSQWRNEPKLIGYVRGFDRSDTSLPYLIGKENHGGRDSLNTRWFAEEDILSNLSDCNKRGNYYVAEALNSGRLKTLPTKVFYTYRQACYVARKLAGENGGNFLVLRAEAKYSAKTEVVKEVW
jgi:hypothetical protein